MFSSCQAGKDENNRECLSEKRLINDIPVNDSSITKSDKSKKRIDLGCLKSDLDMFALSVKKTHLPFELKTDTISEHSPDKDLWDFEKGIFELINPDSTELLVRHNFLMPKTKRILRLYLLELKYSNITESSSFFEKLFDRKDYKADLTGGYYLDYGLTGTTDYIIRNEDVILWFNVSCQYSKKEFNQLIERLKSNITLGDTVEVIKCFCHEGCE